MGQSEAENVIKNASSGAVPVAIKLHLITQGRLGSRAVLWHRRKDKVPGFLAGTTGLVGVR